jgi:hypothetical protein
MADLIADHRRMISEAKDRLQLSFSKETDVTELLGPLKCGGCTACCRSGLAVVLIPPDDVNGDDDGTYAGRLSAEPAGRSAFSNRNIGGQVAAGGCYRRDGFRFLILQLKRREKRCI